MDQQPAEPPIVERVDTENLYQLLLDGQRAGVTVYRDRGEQRVFFHTEVDDAFTGLGLAADLVQQALTDTRASGMRIVPACPYVAKFLTRHDEFGDITDDVTSDVLDWLDEELAYDWRNPER